MSSAVVMILFFVCLLIAIPISVSLGIVSVLPGVFDSSFTASASYVRRTGQFSAPCGPHVHPVGHYHGAGRYFQEAL